MISEHGIAIATSVFGVAFNAFWKRALQMKVGNTADGHLEYDIAMLSVSRRSLTEREYLDLPEVENTPLKKWLMSAVALKLMYSKYFAYENTVLVLDSVTSSLI